MMLLSRLTEHFVTSFHLKFDGLYACPCYFQLHCIIGYVVSKVTTRAMLHCYQSSVQIGIDAKTSETCVMF